MVKTTSTETISLLDCETVCIVEIYGRFGGTCCFCISKDKFRKRLLPNCRDLLPYYTASHSERLILTATTL
jgi:hypothetical protein